MESPPTYKASNFTRAAGGKKRDGYEVLPLQDTLEEDNGAFTGDLDASSNIELSLDNGVFSGLKSHVQEAKSLCEGR